MSLADGLSFRTSAGIAATLWPGGQGVPLLAAHGATCDRGELAATLGPLMGTRPLAALDLPWHGESDAPDDENATTFGRAVLEVMDALGWARCATLGHSLGAWATLMAGCEKPERFAAQLLVGPPGDVTPELSPIFQQFAALFDGDGPLEPIVETALAQWYPQAYRESSPEPRARVLARLSSRSRPTMAAIYRVVAAMPALMDRLPKLTFPVRALLFEEDATPRAWQQPYFDATRATVRVMPGGHFGFEQHPDPWIDEVIAFLEAADAAEEARS